MQNMKKLVLMGLVALMSLMGGVNAQLLYKISGNGLEKPSYIVGTYHLAPGNFADSIPGLKDAFASCKQIYGELDMQDALSNENRDKLEKAQILPEGTTLSSLLTKEQMDRVNALMRETIGADMTNPMLAAQFDKMTPTALSTTLTVFAFIKKSPNFNPMNLLDSHLQLLAQKQGMVIKGLETVDFQVDVLYGGSLEKQVEELMCVVDNFDDVVEMAEFVTAAYFSQDLDQLLDVTNEESEGPCASSPESNDNLIYNRNANWVKAMPDIMQQAPTFFAVGAAHLCGDRGVLRLLEQAGYKIEGVK
jgi:uncharacterized protein YbaP (TraB family)